MKFRKQQRKTILIPSSYGRTEEPEMVEVYEDEVASVLAWRIHYLAVRVAELLDIERVG